MQENDKVGLIKDDNLIYSTKENFELYDINDKMGTFFFFLIVYMNRCNCQHRISKR